MQNYYYFYYHLTKIETSVETVIPLLGPGLEFLGVVALDVCSLLNHFHQFDAL